VCTKVAEKPKLPWRKWMLGTSAVTCAIGPVFTFACAPSDAYACAYICDDDPSCVPRYVASDASDALTEVPSFGDAVADTSAEVASATDASADSVDGATEAATEGSSDAAQDGLDAGSE
jgi:hypothetical protein